MKRLPIELPVSWCAGLVLPACRLACGNQRPDSSQRPPLHNGNAAVIPQATSLSLVQYLAKLCWLGYPCCWCRCTCTASFTVASAAARLQLN